MDVAHSFPVGSGALKGETGRTYLFASCGQMRIA